MKTLSQVLKTPDLKKNKSRSNSSGGKICLSYVVDFRCELKTKTVDLNNDYKALPTYFQNYVDSTLTHRIVSYTFSVQDFA